MGGWADGPHPLLHGSQAGPFCVKTARFERIGHEVVGRPQLPYPRHPRRSWRWLVAYFDKRWFREAVKVAQQAYDACRPDIVVGSSMGGAVAMNLAHRGHAARCLSSRSGGPKR